MSTSTSTVIMLPRPAHVSATLGALRQHLEARGVTFSPDSNVILNDWGGEERDPQFVDTEDEALESIASWPGLGGTEFALKGERLVVFLHGATAYHVDVVTLSVPSGSYASNMEVRDAFDRLSEELHDLLGAKRTVTGFDLLSPGSWILRETQNARRGVFDGQYERDMRR